MLEFKQTETFRKWRIRLKDERIRALIASRLDRLAFGNARGCETGRTGNQRTANRLWTWLPDHYQKRSNTIIILLCGGNKSTQANDIKTAKRLANEWSEKDA